MTTPPLRPSVAITEPDRPRCWIGSLAAYNGSHDGTPRLIGEWFDVTDAGTVTVADLHKGTGVPYDPDDELWVMDLDGHWPVHMEMDPSTAAKWGELYKEVGPTQWPAFCALARSESVTDPEESDVQRFLDRYCGEWQSWRDYVENLVDDLAIFDALPEGLRTYIDLDKYGRDLRYDYTVEDTGDGGVFVFQDA